MKRHTYEQEFLGAIIGGIGSLFGGGGSGGGGGLGGMLKQNDIGGQLISSGIGQLNSAMDAKRDWKYYKKQSALDYEYATKMADYNAQIARDQYDYEYEKESPAARRAQYEAAGLNSALMYGAGGQGMQGAVSSPQGSIPHGSMPHRKSSMDALVAAAQMRQANTQQAIGETTADRNAAAAELDRERALTERRQQLLKDLEVINQNIKNEHDAQMLEILLKQKEEIIRSIGVENRRKEAETRSMDASAALDVARNVAGLPAAEVRQKLAQAFESEEKVKTGFYDAQTYALWKKGQLDEKQKSLIDAQISHFASLTGLNDANAARAMELLKGDKFDTFAKLYDSVMKRYGLDPDDKGLMQFFARWTFVQCNGAINAIDAHLGDNDYEDITAENFHEMYQKYKKGE